MTQEMNRREFIKDTLLASAAGALTLGGQAASAAPAPGKPEVKPLAQPAQSFPNGKIGDLQISRMILGGNLITYYTHARDLNYVRDLAQAYNTQDKIMETLALAEQHGVNALAVSCPPHIQAIMKTYRANGGKMQWIIDYNTPVDEGLKEWKAGVDKLLDMGVDTIYVHGNTSDKLVDAGKMDVLRECVEYIKQFGVPAGVGGHNLEVVAACEKAGIPNDYYIKTFHHHNYPTAPRPDELKAGQAEIPGYWCKDPQALIEQMKSVKKAWIAFKIMAAGAIPPQNAFPWAFENGADHILVGMFDFQIAQDVKIGREAIEKSKAKRTRPWCS